MIKESRTIEKVHHIHILLNVEVLRIRKKSSGEYIKGSGKALNTDEIII